MKRTVFFIIVLFIKVECYSQSLTCFEIFLAQNKSNNTLYDELKNNKDQNLSDITKSLKILTEEAMRPVLREMTEELKAFRFNKLENALKMEASSNLRPRDSALQRSPLEPLRIFENYFDQSILVNFGRSDIMIEVGVTAQNRALVGKVAELFAAFGKHLFFERPDLVTRWENVLFRSKVITNNTFSEGNFDRLFEDAANSILVSFSLLSVSWNKTGLSEAQFIKAVTENSMMGSSTFDILAISFAPGYLGRFGSYMYIDSPIEVTSQNQILLSSNMKSKMQLSKQIWRSLQLEALPTSIADIKETGRGCPMARCVTPNQETELSSFIKVLFEAAYEMN